jgi:toxin-antitoxin system PIN domain toxin
MVVRALLDVNVLIALLDPDHMSHAAAMSWFTKHAKEGWASCPITQNGCIRIMSNPSYPNALPVRAVIKHLADACEQDVHEFWPDGVSLLDEDGFDSTRMHGPRQLTDIYLLGLAVSRGGKFVTFDGRIPLAAVRKASTRHLVVL